jgi:transcriptional regulator with XRE-family HTH domain
MTFAEMIAVNREKLGISRQDFAKKCGIPVELVSYLEEPDVCTERLINQCAEALGMKIAVFMGEEEPELSYAEKVDSVLTIARFPNIRKFLFDPAHCLQPEKALKLFIGEKVSMAERNLILYLSTTALYNFCDSNSSHFNFEEYLFKLHSSLFTRFEEEISRIKLSDEERQDRIDNARKNIFACDSMENIAIRIAEPFADELERRLPKEIAMLKDDLEFPFKWDIDDELLKIKILTHSGSVKNEIKLLTVKEREKSAP